MTGIGDLDYSDDLLVFLDDVEDAIVFPIIKLPLLYRPYMMEIITNHMVVWIVFRGTDDLIIVCQDFSAAEMFLRGSLI